ncbi:MAG: transporter, family, proline/betaine transporter [Pseudonocardiales bacterium]|nr:transporter, family, proline/betaine transporter [Pseudonocardiales bacterium]
MDDQQLVPGHDSPLLRRSIVAGAIGVLVHWFDWAVYAYLATTIAAVFFPEQNPTAGLLSVFAVFAVSFAIRPIGALIFGPLGDRIGRRKTLSIVILTMSSATLVVGLLPSYHSIGILAPILLVVARLLQGLSAGGEFGSAASFLAEHSPAKHRGFGVSWLEVGSLLGFLAASVTIFVLDVGLGQDAVAAWGWRIPFLLAAPLGLIGFYIRRKIEDTPDFRILEEKGNLSEAPLREIFTRNWRPLLRMCGVEVLQHVTFYVVLVFLLTYQTQYLGLSSSNAALASTVTSIVALVLVPAFGALSDRVGRKPVLVASSVALLVLSYPLFLIMRHGGLTGAILSTIGLGVILAMILGTHAVAMAEIFPTRVRQGALSIGYNVMAALFAGTVPYLLTFWINRTQDLMAPALYLVIVAVVGLAATVTLRETVGTRLLTDQDIASGATSTEPEPARTERA